eukprot:5868961-Lingulodinium_polyedra.AAC.1
MGGARRPCDDGRARAPHGGHAVAPDSPSPAERLLYNTPTICAAPGGCAPHPNQLDGVGTAS